MKHDEDWKIIVFHWNRLTRAEKKRIARRAFFYRVNNCVKYGLVLVFVLVARSVTPFPLKLSPSVHYIQPTERRKKHR